MPSNEDILLVPVFNDWAALTALLPHLERELARAARQASIIVLDDSSTEPRPTMPASNPLTAIRSIEVIKMRRNLGHQRAIAVGLSFIAAKRPCRAVVVMDGDGEDMASDVPRLLEMYDRCEGQSVIFAQRTRRSEGALFTAFYRLYRVVHFILTGVRVEVGNFSVISYESIRKLTVASDLWNHYAAAVVHARLSRSLLPTVRGKRLDGRTSMNFVALVAHGISAISVFADRIGVRLLVFTATVVGLLIAGLGIIATLNLVTTVEVPGWARLALTALAVLFGQAAMLSTVFILMIQMSRAQSSFIPARDYEFFVEGTIQTWPTP